MLMEALKGELHGIDADYIVKEIYERRCILWTWGGGILLTAIRAFPSGDELWVSQVYGRDYLRNMDKVDSDIFEIARQFKCKWVSAEIKSEALARTYEKHGAATVAFLMTRSV